MPRGRKKRNVSRPLRYPNGYGSVYQLSQPERRRKPFIVQVPDGMRTSIGKDGIARTKYAYRVLGYAETWEEGDRMLKEWHSSMVNDAGVVITKRSTFAEIYEVAWPRAIKNTGKSAIKAYNAAYKKLEPLYDMPITEIKTATMQSILDAMQLLKMSAKTIWNVKYVCSVVFSYAYENDLVQKNYAEFLNIGKAEPTKEKRIFTQREIDLLFEHDDYPFVDVILIYIYTGLRLNELLSIKCADVHLEERYMIGGSKTNAGKNRAIPISHKIEKYVAAWYDKGHEYLITDENGQKMNDAKFRPRFNKALENLGLMDITCHCCRHTTATLLDNANVNKVAAQKILGHKGSDITEKVYIHKDLEQLLNAIDMI